MNYVKDRYNCLNSFLKVQSVDELRRVSIPGDTAGNNAQGSITRGYCRDDAQGSIPVDTALSKVGGNGQSIELASLTPLFVADCGRLQLGAPHWAISVALLQVVDN